MANSRLFAVGAPDTAAAGQTILSLVLDGRLPYAVPPPVGDPVHRVHIGVGGVPVGGDKYAAGGAEDAAGAGGGGGGGEVEDDEGVSEEEEDEEDDEDDEEGAVINPFRLLGIDEEGEAQYGSGDIDDGGAGRFKVKDSDGKGAAARFFGSGGSGAGGSMFMSEADLKKGETTRGTRTKGKKGRK